MEIQCSVCQKKTTVNKNNQHKLCVRCSYENAPIVGQNKLAKKAGLPHDLTLLQWKKTLAHFHGGCAYCGKKPTNRYDFLVIEHFIPMCKGGGTTISNCVPACIQCNSRKRNLHPSQVTSIPRESLEKVQFFLEQQKKVSFSLDNIPNGVYTNCQDSLCQDSLSFSDTKEKIMEATMSKFEASAYQQAIFDAVERYDHDIVVSAVAGSGKSTTLKQLLDYIPAHMSVLYLAFNSDAAKSLGEKLTSYAQEKADRHESVCNYTSSTIHSLGNSTLRSAGISNKPKSNKYSQLCKAYLMDHMQHVEYSLIPQFSKLVDMVRLTLSDTDEKSLLKLMARFEIDIETEELNDDDRLVETEAWSVIKYGVAAILKQGITLAKQAKEYDFTDMIWLPSSQAMNLQPRQYDWVLVDEAQDLSPAQRELVLKARKASGHFIAVGDRKQAIYGFAGASLRSIDEIIEATGAVEMPLSICYRCPKSVIDLANTIWAGTEARPNAPEGTLERIAKDKVESLVQPGDLILCRLTAPLVEKCLELLRKGIRANVRGKDLGSQFMTLLENIKKAAHVSDTQLFLDLVNVASAYERHQIQLLSRNLDENEMKIDSLQDKMATLLALYEAYLDQAGDYGSLVGFQDYIKAFFADDPSAQIILSTGHRAKGLEYKRVFILQSDKLPHPKAKTLEAITQEYNLMYVMYTRAMEALYLVQEAVIPVILVETPEIVEAEATVEEIKPEPQPTVKTLLPTTKHKGGAGHKSELSVKVAYKFSAEVAEKLNKLAEDTGVNKSAFIDGLLAQWFEEHGR